MSQNLNDWKKVSSVFLDSSVELYSQLELQCKVDAHPPPKLHWFHNTTRLSTTDKVHISEDGTTVYLKMVDFNNLGLYSCEADNGFETMRANGTLSVSGLGNIVLFINEQLASDFLIIFVLCPSGIRRAGHLSDLWRLIRWLKPQIHILSYFQRSGTSFTYITYIHSTYIIVMNWWRFYMFLQ